MAQVSEMAVSFPEYPAWNSLPLLSSEPFLPPASDRWANQTYFFFLGGRSLPA